MPLSTDRLAEHLLVETVTQIRTFVDAGDQVLILVNTIEQVDQISAALDPQLRTATTTGCADVDERRGALDAFNDGDLDVLVVTVAAFSTGWRTTSSNVTTLFPVPIARDVDELQARDRIHRTPTPVG